MGPSLQAVRSILLVLICVCAWQSIDAQQAGAAVKPPALTVEEIVNNLVRRNLERAQSLSAYQGTRVYKLEYRGFPGARDAEMTVDVKYQSPATKEFTVRSSSGSKLLIERVFNKLLQSEQEALTPENQSHVTLNNENYTFTLTGQESTPAGSYYILTVEPRTKNKLLYRGKIWVEATDFAVARIEVEPAKSPSFWTKDTKIVHVYNKVGDFWLPTSNRSNSNTRLGGHALLTIDYRDYKVTAIPAHPNSDGTVPGSR
jgi:hypothetical protein